MTTIVSTAPLDWITVCCLWWYSQLFICMRLKNKSSTCCWITSFWLFFSSFKTFLCILFLLFCFVCIKYTVPACHLASLLTSGMLNFAPDISLQAVQNFPPVWKGFPNVFTFLYFFPPNHKFPSKELPILPVYFRPAGRTKTFPKWVFLDFYIFFFL